MTGDDHASGGTAGRFDGYKAASPAGCSVADWECVRSDAPTSTQRTRSPTRRRPPTTRRASRSACTSTRAAATSRPASLEANFADQLGDFAREVPEHRRARHEPDPLHRVERLGDAAARSSSRTASGSTRTTTTGRRLGPRPAGHVHRLRHADAVRRPRRHDDRRLPGDDADDRRVGPDLPAPRRHAARQRARRRGLLRRLHREHAHRQRAPSPAPTRSSPPRRRAACRSSPPSRCSTWLDGRNGSSFGSLAWSGDTLSFTIAVGAGANGLQAMVPTQSAVGALTGLTRGGSRSPTPRRRSRASSTRSSTRRPAPTWRRTRPTRRRPSSPRWTRAGDGDRDGHLDDQRGGDLARRLRDVARRARPSLERLRAWRRPLVS